MLNYTTSYKKREGLCLPRPQAVEKARLRRSFPLRVAPFAYSLRLGFIGARSTAVLRACKTSRLRVANCLRQLCPQGTRFPPPHRAANGVRKPCYARLPAPPRMSLGPDYTWRAAALQASHGFIDRLGLCLPKPARPYLLGRAVRRGYSGALRAQAPAVLRFAGWAAARRRGGLRLPHAALQIHRAVLPEGHALHLQQHAVRLRAARLKRAA